MIKTKEDFLEAYKDFFKSIEEKNLLSVDTYNEYMHLLSIGFLVLSYEEMESIKPEMDKIKERYF